MAMNALKHHGVLIEDPDWWVEKIYVDDKEVDSSELPLGAHGPLYYSYLDYIVHRVLGITLKEHDNYLTQHKIKIVVKSRLGHHLEAYNDGISWKFVE